MIFLFNTPVLAGFGNYLLPLMIGARDMAFPRLNAFSYWVFLFSGIFMYTSFLIGKAPNGGWFAYVPLTDSTYSPGVNLDFWGLGVIFVGISTTAGAINFIVTTFKLRAPGMTLNRLPVFVWSLLGMAFMVLFAFPAVTVAAATAGGRPPVRHRVLRPDARRQRAAVPAPVLVLGPPRGVHPVPAGDGMVSMIIPVFSRRPLGRLPLDRRRRCSAIAFISFGVWVHHMFATGLPAQAMGFFSAASLVIALPSAVQYFAWIGTMWERQGDVRAADAVRHRLPRDLPARRDHRGDGGGDARSTFRSPTATSSSPTSTTCSTGRWCSRSSAPSTTGTRR